MKELLIVRDFLGRPLKRSFCGAANGLVYVANPDLVEAVNSGESHPVGFPSDDAYLFENEAYSMLTKEWMLHGRIAEENWGRLRNYRPE